MKKNLIALFFLLAVAGCAQQNAHEIVYDEEVQFTLRLVGSDGSVISSEPVYAYAGQSVFTALKNSDFPFTYEEQLFGAFLTSIGALKPTENEYLAVYLNGEYASVGISDLIPENGDKINFKIEKISESEFN